MVKDTVIKQWHATIKMAGSWKRPDATAMVIPFFFTVIHLLSLRSGGNKMHVYENGGKFIGFVEVCSQLNIMEYHTVSFICNRTFGGTCLIVQTLATKSQNWWQKSLTDRQKWCQKPPVELIKSLLNKPNHPYQVCVQTGREEERRFEFNLRMKFETRQTIYLPNWQDLQYAQNVIKWRERKIESRNW